MQRLQKVLANAGVASRRKAEKLIEDGRVKVNGIPVTELGSKVSERDKISVDNKPVELKYERMAFILNKPAGYLSTCSDQRNRQTVLELMPKIPGLHPVGRLDKDTTGLIILTNDGDLTFKIAHPKHEIEKEYEAVFDGEFTENHEKILLQGINLDDGKVKPKQVKIISSNENSSTVRLVITEGRNREVRRIFYYFGFKVKELKRIRIGKINLGILNCGQYKKLTIDQLKTFD